MATSVKNLPDREVVMPGNGACAGCPATAALRIVGKALGENAIALMTPSCTVASIGLLPKSAFDFPIMNITFASAGSSAAGMVYALEALEKKGRLKGEMPTVFNWIGDGGTYDIGMQAISAAAERNDNFIHICYNNEAYSNTGVQRSGATPKYAATTTTPLGKLQNKKDMPRIMLEHGIPYLATASLAYPGDLYDKLVKAKNIKGFKYIEIFAPCCTGWKFAPEELIKYSRLAVECGAWMLYEATDGKISFQGATKHLIEGGKSPAPLLNYLAGQGRFSSLMNAENRDELIKELSEGIANGLRYMKKRAEI